MRPSCVKHWTRIAALSIVSAFWFGATANGQTPPLAYVTGNKLFPLCSPEIRDACHAYVLGVVDALSLHGPEGGFCLPSLVSNGQLTEIATSYMRAHPDIRLKPAAYLVKLALTEVFPCNSR
jgi:Rap1a immunity proteins